MRAAYALACAFTAACVLRLLWAVPPVREAVVNVLARVGLVRVRTDGTVAWPVRLSPWWVWRVEVAVGLRAGAGLLRNRPGVRRRIPGRWLPPRWGFRVLGLEVGDRGGHPRLLLLQDGRAVEVTLRVRVGGRPFLARYMAGSWYVWEDRLSLSPVWAYAPTFEEALRLAEEAERISWETT